MRCRTPQKNSTTAGGEQCPYNFQTCGDRCQRAARCAKEKSKGRGKKGVDGVYGEEGEETRAEATQDLGDPELSAIGEALRVGAGQSGANLLGPPPARIRQRQRRHRPWAKHPDPLSGCDPWMKDTHEPIPSPRTRRPTPPHPHTTPNSSVWQAAPREHARWQCQFAKVPVDDRADLLGQYRANRCGWRERKTHEEVKIDEGVRAHRHSRPQEARGEKALQAAARWRIARSGLVRTVG